MRRLRISVLAAVVIGLGGMSAPRPAGAADAIVIKVTPAFATAPGFIRVTATIAASDENRFLEIAADSQDFFRSSRIPLTERRPRDGPSSRCRTCRPASIRYGVWSKGRWAFAPCA